MLCYRVITRVQSLDSCITLYVFMLSSFIVLLFDLLFVL